MAIQSVKTFFTHSDIIEQLFIRNWAEVVCALAAKHSSTTPTRSEKRKSSHNATSGMNTKLRQLCTAITSSSEDMSWTKSALEQAARGRVRNYVKFETGRNLPPVLKRPAHAALT